MTSFAVYLNRNPDSKSTVPYLLDVQSDLLSGLNTRVVIPLFLKSSVRIAPMSVLMPEFEVLGKKVVLMTPQLAGIPVKELGKPVGSLKQYRPAIIAALDLLITGF